MKEQSLERNTQLQCLSIHGTATALREKEGCEAGRAIDGREDTCWEGGPYYVWWQLDLTRLCRIAEIRILPVSEGFVHYFIETSEDRLNWRMAAEKTDDRLSDAEGERYAVHADARYVRVTFTYHSAGENVKLREVQVFGQVLEEPAPRTRVSPRLFPAVGFDEAEGFSEIVVEDIEPGQKDRVIVSGGPGSFVAYREVDFGKSGVDQLRGGFGFTDLDKEKRVVLEVRLDRPDGTCIGRIVLFKQWKRWSDLAGDLAHENPDCLTGVHDVYLVIAEASPNQQLMIHWLAFVRRTALPAPGPRPAALPAPAGGEYQIFFGNLHSHTGFSDGIGVPDEAYDYARYTAGLDFLAITEHSNLYDHYLDWDKSRKWKDIQKIAERKTEDGKFLALFGAETTWYNQFGHMNTYNMDFFINAYETRYNDVARYYETIKQYKDSIHQWNHPWSCGKRHLDLFEPYDAEVDEVLHMIELNTIECKELGGLYYYVMALDKGWHVAPVGSQDNHHGQWGTQNTLRTGVLVERLTREHFYDAVRHQRVYFTSALYLKVWFKVNGAVMGSRIRSGEPVDIEVKAMFGQDTGHRIVRMEVFGERGQVLHAIEHDGKELEYSVSLPGDQRYYFVKVYQDDGEFAVTAPVWAEKS